MLSGIILAAWAVAQAPPAPPSPHVEPFTYEVLSYRDRLEKDGSSVRTTDVAVRLGTPQGVEQFGQLADSYVEGYGEVLFEAVRIEKPDGRRVEVKGVVEDVNPLGVTGSGVPADFRVRKLTLPGLETGDRLSWRLVHRQRPLAPGHVFGSMKLPPVASGFVQTYELDVPRQPAIAVRLRDGLGTGWEEVSSPPDRLVRRLRLKVELPARGAVLSKEQREGWIEPDVTFSSFGSWPEVASWWWALSKDRTKGDGEVAKLAAELTRAMSTPREKLVALHAFTAGQIRYLNVGFGIGRLQPRPATEILSSRYGDCKDKHTLLAALAASVGIDVRPVLVHTEVSHLHDEAPGPQQFNHMISLARLGEAGDQAIWLDTTNAFAPPGHLPPALRDKPVLVVERDGGGRLVTTPADLPFPSRFEQVFNGKLDAEGILRGRVSWRHRSDTEVQLRAIFASVPRDRLQEVVKSGVGLQWTDAKVENVSISDPLDLSSPFRIEFDLERRVPAKGGERSVELPISTFDLPAPLDPAPAGDPSVSFDVAQQVGRVEIELPEEGRGRAPLSVSLERPFGSFRSTYAVEGRILRAERTLALKERTLEEAGTLAAYRSFRASVEKDQEQAFAVEGLKAVASSAGELRSEGLAAFEKKEYAKAAELLQKAAEADPKLKDVWEDLGQARYRLDRDEEAVAAFTRQIEETPFHESAYAWRAYTLQRLLRWEEAEKDLLKQIEVAPFKPWSYEKLAERRFAQARYQEAVDYYSRAAAIEPKEAERWLDLAGAQRFALQIDDMKASLDKALALQPADWMTVRAAWLLRAAGDVARAGELAQSVLPALASRLSKLTADTFGDGDTYWSERLVEAWHCVGEAALSRGDTARAERYLEAAWRLGFSAAAAWKLGEVRERQGRPADAVMLWSIALEFPSAKLELPPDASARLDGVCARLPPGSGPLRDSNGAPRPGHAACPVRDFAGSRLSELRTVRVPGPAPGDFSAQVLLLVDSGGRIERISLASSSRPGELDSQVARLGAARLEFPVPDDGPYKSVRRALLACSRVTGCALVLDLPGALPTFLGTSEIGSVRAVNLQPPNGSVLTPGQQVTVVARLRYDLKVDKAKISLGIADEGGRELVRQSAATVTGPSGEVTLQASFTVPEKATEIWVLMPLFRDQGAPDFASEAARYAVRQD